MKRRALIYPGIIYLMGLTITLVYAFTTHYTTVSDTAREYLIYTAIAQGSDWQALITGEPFTLQSTCLTVTFIPAYLQRFLGVESLLFFKLYSCFLIPFLPVVIYLIARQFALPLYAFLVAVFFMGQVCFLQAPSMARSNIALLFFALSVLVILQFNRSMKAKAPILFMLAIGIVISHYSTTFVSLFIFLAAGAIILVLEFVKKVQLPHRNSILIMCLSLLIGITVWYGLITQTPLAAGIRFLERFASAEVQVEGENGEGETYSITEIKSRDKIIQAAFGVTNPDGDTTFTFNWSTFVFSWLTIILLSYGFFISLVRWRWRIAVPSAYLILSVIGFSLIGVVAILPWVSRGYGIERTYYQMLVFLGVYFIFGCSDIAARFRLKPYVIILPILLPYFYFIFTTGIIHSIIGG